MTDLYASWVITIRQVILHKFKTICVIYFFTIARSSLYGFPLGGTRVIRTTSGISFSKRFWFVFFFFFFFCEWWTPPSPHGSVVHLVVVHITWRARACNVYRGYCIVEIPAYRFNVLKWLPTMDCARQAEKNGAKTRAPGTYYCRKTATIIIVFGDDRWQRGKRTCVR